MPNAEMPNAPPLNLNIPSWNGGGSGSRAYAAGLQFATALKDQALRGQQQQQVQAHQAQQDQQKADNEYATETEKYRQAGAVPAPQFDTANVNRVGQNGAVGVQPTLKRDQSGVQLNAGQEADDPNHIQIDSRGKAYHYPTLEEREKAKTKPVEGIIPTGKLLDYLNQTGAAPKDGQVLPWSDLHTLMGSAGLAVPPPEALTTDYEHYSDASGNPAAVQTGTRTGNQKVVAPPTGLTQNPQAEKNSGTYDVVPGGKGANGGPLLRNNKTNEIIEGEMPKGAKIGLTDAQQEVANRFAITRAEIQDRRDQAAQDRKDKQDADKQAKGQAAIAAFQVKEDAAHKQRELIGNALTATPGEDGRTMVIDPTVKSNGQDTAQEVELTPARRSALTAAYNSASEAAEKQYAAKQKIIKANGGEVGAPLKLDRATPPPAATAQPTAQPKAQQQQTPAAPAQKTAAPPAAAPAPDVKPLAPWSGLAKPAAPQSKGKLTDAGTAKQYLQKAGGDKAQARKLAKADGWEF